MLNNYKQDSLFFAVIYKKGKLHLQQKEQDSFYFYSKLLLKESVEHNNVFYKAKSTFNLGYYFDGIESMPDSSFYYYNQAKNDFLKSGFTTKAGEVLINIAILEKNKTDFFNAKASLTKALQYIGATSGDKYIASIYNELGTNNLKLSNFTDAVNYYNKAIRITNSKHDSYIYKNNLALSYIEQENYDVAIALLEQLIVDLQTKKETILYARVLHNLSYANWLKSGKNTLPEFLTALGIRKQKKDLRGQLQSFTNLAEYFIEENPSTAHKYLDSLISLSRILINPRAETDALNLFMKLYPQQVKYKDRYIFLKDSLYQQELKVKTQFAKMKYDDEQEKTQILDLQHKAIEEKAALSMQKTQKILFLSLSGLLLVTGILLYYILRQRHKKEKLKEVYKTEQLISKRLHDELSNDIYGLIATIEQNPNKDKNYLLDNLEKLYGQTRTISHDNREIDTGEAFSEELIDALSVFYSNETTVLVKGLDNIAWENISDYCCIAIHRTLNEFMVNMKKHSEASLVAIHFKDKDGVLNITYSDNGIGMHNEQKLGVGLKNTVSRIESVNGKITFDSELGNGTTIFITIPHSL